MPRPRATRKSHSVSRTRPSASTWSGRQRGGASISSTGLIRAGGVIGNELGATRRPLTWSSFTDKELWRQAVEKEVHLGQNIGLYTSDETAPRGPRHDHYPRAGRPQGPSAV